ncbi:MAG: hypothetical protein UT08_C0003G0120 [Candidatus Woesebacteria bacterium GW2011_GWB1_38_8]|uniref:Uncharacterized protein n=1 Tax=Candidatus Woesebacteria bacterium GW2011_GWB1_38_8 TaxID=1618570 RepID=A0A0G0L4K6_9BACT|nr:MAG: hypothetical protein UT08_C0003G0120 [Candidatus Woesebacteria bacterium GW2011_GWB1_38_8]
MGDGETSKPSMEEIFGGKDVFLGKEMVDNLIAEEVGLPVYRYTINERKTNFIVDRKPGEDDFTVREKSEVPQQLQGLILPTGNQDEFVFFGIQEPGFVFKCRDALSSERFDPQKRTSYKHSRDRFSGLVSDISSFEATLSEDD